MRALPLLLVVALLAPAAAARDAVRLAYAVKEDDRVLEGDVAPGQTIVYDLPEDAPNLTAASFALAWDAPALGGASFALVVEPPPGVAGSAAQGNAGPLRVAAEGLPPVPASDVVPSAQLAQRLDMATSRAGEGAWEITVRAAPGATAADRLMARHYRLEAQWLRYEAVAMTDATGGPDYGVMAVAPDALGLAWVGGAVLLGAAACILLVALLARRERRNVDPALPEGDNTRSAER